MFILSLITLQLKEENADKDVENGEKDDNITYADLDKTALKEGNQSINN